MVKKCMCLVLAMLTVFALCACGGDSSNSTTTTATTAATEREQTPEEAVREEVQARANFAYFGSSIGGNELTRSSATITNIKEVSIGKYRVSGRMVMTDIYGTKWHNTFDCEVTKLGDSWSAGSFKYTSNSWTKG